jgi:hypothetical protein
MFPPPSDFNALPPGPAWLWLVVGVLMLLVFAWGLWGRPR